MRLLEVKNDIAKIIYNPADNRLLPSDFLLIEDYNQKIVGQILSVYTTEDSNNNVADVRLALYIDKEDKISYYNGYIPQKTAKVLYITADEITEMITSSDTNIYLGNLTYHPKSLVKVPISLVNERLYIQCDRDDNTKTIVQNIVSSLYMKQRKVVLLDFDGRYNRIANVPRLTVSESFNFPLNIDAFNNILEYDTVDCPIEDKAVIQSIVLELRDYVKTLENKFLPFTLFKNVVISEFAANPISGLMVLRNKLWQYAQEGMFAESKADFDIINKVMQHENILIIDASKIEEKWHRFAIQTIPKILNSRCYFAFSMNDIPMDKRSIVSLYNNPNIVPIIATSYDSPHRNLLKSLAKNQILFKPAKQTEVEEQYGALIHKLNDNDFILFGEASLKLPLIIELKTFDIKTSEKIAEQEIRRNVDKILSTGKSMLPKEAVITESKQITNDYVSAKYTVDEDFTDDDLDYLDKVHEEDITIEDLKKKKAELEPKDGYDLFDPFLADKDKTKEETKQENFVQNIEISIPKEMKVEEVDIKYHSDEPVENQVTVKEEITNDENTDETSQVIVFKEDVNTNEEEPTVSVFETILKEESLKQEKVEEISNDIQNVSTSDEILEDTQETAVSNENTLEVETSVQNEENAEENVETLETYDNKEENQHLMQESLFEEEFMENSENNDETPLTFIEDDIVENTDEVIIIDKSDDEELLTENNFNIEDELPDINPLETDEDISLDENVTVDEIENIKSEDNADNILQEEDIGEKKSLEELLMQDDTSEETSAAEKKTLEELVEQNNDNSDTEEKKTLEELLNRTVDEAIATENEEKKTTDEYIEQITDEDLDFLTEEKKTIDETPVEPDEIPNSEEEKKTSDEFFEQDEKNLENILTEEIVETSPSIEIPVTDFENAGFDDELEQNENTEPDFDDTIVEEITETDDEITSENKEQNEIEEEVNNISDIIQQQPVNNEDEMYEGEIVEAEEIEHPVHIEEHEEIKETTAVIEDDTAPSTEEPVEEQDKKEEEEISDVNNSTPIAVETPEAAQEEKEPEVLQVQTNTETNEINDEQKTEPVETPEPVEETEEKTDERENEVSENNEKTEIVQEESEQINIEEKTEEDVKPKRKKKKKEETEETELNEQEADEENAAIVQNIKADDEVKEENEEVQKQLQELKELQDEVKKELKELKKLKKLKKLKQEAKKEVKKIKEKEAEKAKKEEEEKKETAVEETVTVNAEISDETPVETDKTLEELINENKKAEYEKETEEKIQKSAKQEKIDDEEEMPIINRQKQKQQNVQNNNDEDDEIVSIDNLIANIKSQAKPKKIEQHIRPNISEQRLQNKNTVRRVTKNTPPAPVGITNDKAKQKKLTVYETDTSAEVLTEGQLPFKVGDKVYHPKHGKGIVEGFANYSNKILFCQIEFENVGRRILDPRISGLEKIN